MLVLDSDAQGKNYRLKIWSSISVSGAVADTAVSPSTEEKNSLSRLRLDLMAEMSSCLLRDVATDVATDITAALRRDDGVGAGMSRTRLNRPLDPR